ncbi:MAG: hypothetical protein IJ814_01075 [Paludibacteraceae bacterium]|nr:hypothetical protein [Paludibacteraceae bacterium]
MKTTIKNILLVISATLCLNAESATKPHYDFYSTSMLSPNKQSNYAPSHINQSGKVKVQSNTAELRSFNRRMAGGTPGEVFSADLFHRAAAAQTIGGGGESFTPASSSNTHHSGSRGVNYTNQLPSVSLSALKISRQNTENITVAAATADEAGRPSHNRFPGTPGSEGEQLPLGDAVLPLMLMAILYTGVRLMRRKPAKLL